MTGMGAGYASCNGITLPPPMNWVAFPLAVVASASNAGSNVLQRAANREEPPELKLRPRLILELVRRPLWLCGIGTVIASFILMTAALSMGSLATIQPIIILELPLTLIGAAQFFGTRLRSREWLAVVAMTAGLAGLIFFLRPGGGTGGRASGVGWAVGVAASLGAVAFLSLLGRRSRGLKAAAFLGTGTGVTFGLTAAFMKGMTASFHEGPVGVLSSWQTYAMVASGLAGMYLLQSALHSGQLIASQPGITLADPLVAILWGVLVFGEEPRGGADLALAIVAGAVMALATVVLVRSPLLAAVQLDEEEQEERENDAVEGAKSGAADQDRAGSLQPS